MFAPNIFHIHYIPLGLRTFAWLLRVSIHIYIYVESGEKKIMFYPFAVILNFLLPLDHEVDKMSLSQENEVWKYIMNLILFQISDLFGFS